MSLLSIPKTVVERSLKTRVPLEFALGAAGLKRQSPAGETAAKLIELEEREQTLEAEEKAVQAKGEAERLREATEKAKEARRKVE